MNTLVEIKPVDPDFEAVLRILHVLNELRMIGNGIVNVAVDTACEQAKLGHTVAVASAGGAYEDLLKEYGVRHFQLDQARTLKNIVPCVRNYLRIVKTFKPEIVHAHMMTGVVLAKYFRFTSHYKIFSTIHNEFQRSARLMGLADHVIALSAAGAEAMAKQGISRQKIHIISNGCIGSPRTKSRAEVPAKKLLSPAIVTVAGMYERKGIADLINSLTILNQSIPGVQLYLVGDGPTIDEFRQLALDVGLADQIHFEGYQTNPRAYLQSAAIFVLCSHAEPYSLALIEAREMACVIVATNVGGNPDILDFGNAGVLVPPHEPAALARAFESLLKDSSKATKLEANTQVNIERFEVRRMVKDTLASYMLP